MFDAVELAIAILLLADQREPSFYVCGEEADPYREIHLMNDYSVYRALRSYF